MGRKVARPRRCDKLVWVLRATNRMLQCHSVPALLDLAYDAVRTDLGYDRVGITLIDAESSRLLWRIGTDERGTKYYPVDRSVALDSDDANARLVADPRLGLHGPGFIYVADCARDLPPDVQRYLDGRPRQGLYVALRGGDQVLGIISVDNLTSGRSMTAADAPPLVTFANALAIALSHARTLERLERRVDDLHADLQRRLAELEWLRDIGRVVNAAGSLDEVLDAVYHGVRDGLGYDRVGIQLCDHEQGIWEELRGTDEQGRALYPDDRAYSLAPDSPIWQVPDIAAILSGAEFYYTRDQLADAPPALRHLLDGDSAAMDGLPGLTVPLRSGEALIGMVCVDNALTRRHIAPEDAGPLLALANGVGTAVENARRYAAAAHRATCDPLTGLLNHRAMLERIDAALRDALPFALLLIDVDNFKLFNDTHGHPIGDAVLLRVATLLGEACRDGDVAARHGGDEFALILDGAGPREAADVARRLDDTVRSRHYTTPDGALIPLSISIGVACYPSDGPSRPGLMAVADAAMYAAKRQGITSPHRSEPLLRGERVDDGLRARGAADLLGDSPFGVLDGLVAAVDAKDHYTAAHSEDVARWAVALARALDLPTAQQQVLALAGRLHDLGKIATPDRILRKPGRLTDDEYETLKRHVTYGVAIIRGVLDDPDVVDAVAYHHERWDGAGYPHGLPGPATPLLGRIMQLADATSAMLLDRPYRHGLPWQEVVARLRAGAGTQFDPALVEPFIACARSDHAAYPDQHEEQQESQRGEQQESQHGEQQESQRGEYQETDNLSVAARATG